MTDTFDIDGFDNVQYHTPADLLPFGITAKIGYAPSANASAANDYLTTGAVNDRIATPDTASAGGITLDGGGNSTTQYQIVASAIPLGCIAACCSRCYPGHRRVRGVRIPPLLPESGGRDSSACLRNPCRYQKARWCGQADCPLCLVAAWVTEARTRIATSRFW
jgi:hypothetical protein